jgi:hypothetical protein
MTDAFDHFNKIAAICSNDKEKSFFIAIEDIHNDYSSHDGIPKIPAGSFVMADFGGDFGLYARYDAANGGTTKCKITADDFHKLHPVTESEMQNADERAKEAVESVNLQIGFQTGFATSISLVAADAAADVELMLDERLETIVGYAFGVIRSDLTGEELIADELRTIEAAQAEAQAIIASIAERVKYVFPRSNNFKVYSDAVPEATTAVIAAHKKARPSHY